MVIGGLYLKKLFCVSFLKQVIPVASNTKKALISTVKFAKFQLVFLQGNHRKGSGDVVSAVCVQRDR